MNQDTASRSILIIDDEPLVLKFAASVIARLGYTVKKAQNGAEARQLMATESFHAVISDVSLPDADGRDILREAMLLHPDTHGVLMSGFSTADLQLAGSPNLRYLEKPFTPGDLSRLLAEIFDLETACAL